jgi:hypothetical protein
VLGDLPENTRLSLHMTQLRMHAESVPDLMSPYIGDFGHRTIFKHYRQITEALRRLQTADEEEWTSHILEDIDDQG